MKKSSRLDGNARPANYKIFFDIDLGRFSYIGREEIDIEVSKPSDEVSLNSSDLAISKACAIQDGKATAAVIKADNKAEILTLKFPRKIRGNAKLHIEFSGKLNDNLLGFYRSRYTHNGKEKYMATTHFEAPYARRAFPCFDEPGMKATFELSLRIDGKLEAVSNTPVRETVKDGRKKIVHFNKTPKMSTYLLYACAGELEFLEGHADKILVRVVTTPGKRQQGALALEMTKKFLKYFQDYSGIPYPLPKLDIIALPDFIVGAMENWGAITFREVYLLFDEKMTSTSSKKRMAMIIAHELWHQWSGDLVTMKWWNDLWLNESFATFMAYKAVDHSYPDFKIWEDFIRGETERALEEDSMKTTHPIEVTVHEVHEMEELFDAISYSKGGSILNMLEGYLGHEIFRKGISNYLGAYKYSNAASEDLWNSLSGVSKLPIKDIMASWIGQPGYPLVEASSRKGVLSLSQKRFVFNCKTRQKWMIPLVIGTEKGKIKEILDSSRKEIPLDSSWFKLNSGQKGFYRTKYTDGIENLKPAIAGRSMSVADRWGLQNDAFKLAVNGNSTLDAYLDLLKSYKNEDSYIVLSSIHGALRSMHFAFCTDKFWPAIWPAYRNFFIWPFRDALKRLGWEPKWGEKQQDTLLREMAINYLAFAEDPDVIKSGIERFEAYISKKAALHPDIKSPVFYMAAANGNKGTYKRLLGVYKNTKSPEEKRTALLALGMFRDKSILKDVLDFSVSREVRRQDFPIIISSITSNPLSRSLLMKWAARNWKYLKSYEKTGQILIMVIESIITTYVDKESEKELKKFFAAHPVRYKATLKKSFEKLKRSIALRQRNAAILEKYFSHGRRH